MGLNIILEKKYITNENWLSIIGKNIWKKGEYDKKTKPKVLN